MKLPFSIFLEVHWHDAVSDDGWVEVDKVSSPQLMITRGWLVKETKDYIILAGSIYSDDDRTVGSTQTIPSGMIVERKELKITPKKVKVAPLPNG